MNESSTSPGHRPGDAPWDKWERAVKERGMDGALAGVGQLILRRSEQHNWAEPLRQLCAPEALEELLLHAPKLGRELCMLLLETEGLRIAFTEDEDNYSIALAGFGGK